MPRRPPEPAPFLAHPAAHRAGTADPDWSTMRRILVVRPDNVGDVLMAGPALRALAAAAPRARLDLLASPAGAAAAGLLPEVDDVVVASVSWQQLPGDAAGPDGRIDPDPDAGVVAALAARRYDAAVVLTSFSQSPWAAAEVARRAGVPVRVGASKEFGGAALTHWVPAPPDDGHQVDRMLYVLRALGVPVDGAGGIHLHADVPEAARARIDALVRAEVGAVPYAVVLPGASCPSRRYSAERFAAAARALAADGLRVVVTGTTAEADLVARAVEGVEGAVGLAGRLDLPELAALLAGAEVVVANNSGGVHLADAVGTPVVDLFAGTETVDQYRPRSVPAEVLSRPTSCAPCRQLVCPFDQECLDVDPAEVAGAARRLLPLAVR